MNTTRKGLATRLIHTAEGHQPGAVPLTTPIYETTTFVFDSTAELQAYIDGGSDSYFYSRYDNPSLHALEAKLAEAEDAEAAMVFASGMGAIASTMLSLLSAGDEVVCSAAIYGGTLHLLQSFLRAVRRDDPLRRTRSTARSHRSSSARRRRWCGSSRRSIRRCGAWTSPAWRRRAVPPVSSR